jgi:hypothetical protein
MTMQCSIYLIDERKPQVGVDVIELLNGTPDE